MWQPSEVKIFTGEEVADFALDCHYPKWDTLGREESDLPERILPHGPYQLAEIKLEDLEDESPWDCDEEKVAELKNSNPENWPPIVYADGEVLDGWHRVIAAKALGRKTIKTYTPK